jgi:hypothetical protein
MPRYPNFPDTTEAIRRLELSYLRKIGLLRPGFHSTTLNWTHNGRPSGRIALESAILPAETYVRLRYTVNDTDAYDYRIQLEAVPSNLGTGHRYYFLCPSSGRRATILYMPDGVGRFAHRLAFTSRLYYESQLEPKLFRGLGVYFEADRAWEKEYRKGRKTHYQGKPTKWYATLLRLEQQADRVGPIVEGMMRSVLGP